MEEVRSQHDLEKKDLYRRTIIYKQSLLYQFNSSEERKLFFDKLWIIAIYNFFDKRSPLYYKLYNSVFQLNINYDEIQPIRDSNILVGEIDELIQIYRKYMNYICPTQLIKEVNEYFKKKIIKVESQSN